MPRLTQNQRWRVIAMIENGMSVSETARQVGVSRKPVRLWYRGFQTTGTVTDRPRHDRPRVTTRQQGRHLVLTHLQNRFQPVTVTARTIPALRRIHPDTVRNRLMDHGLHARRLTERPSLQLHHRAARLARARNHLHYRINSTVEHGTIFR